MTEGFGHKWKDFFHTLEDHHHLNVSLPSHIWLLQRLFLPAINEDALNWAETWNLHKIQLEGEKRRSPHQLYSIGSLIDGVRGLPPQEEDDQVDDSYGIDWEATEGYRNAAEDEMGYDQPDWVNNVVCEPPGCPLNDEEVEQLMEDLRAVVDVESRNMDARRVVWVKAFELLSHYDGVL